MTVKEFLESFNKMKNDVIANSKNLFVTDANFAQFGTQSIKNFSNAVDLWNIDHIYTNRIQYVISGNILKLYMTL